MPTAIAPEVLQALSTADTEGDRLVLTAQLDRKVYVATNKVLEALGGKWNRGAKAHVFPCDAADLLDAVLVTGAYVDGKREFDAFYTPPDLATRVVDVAAHVTDFNALGDRDRPLFLEPSAGEGALATEAARRGALVWTLDVRPDLPDWRAPLAGDVADRITALPAGDFLNLRPADVPAFDRVIMNPPFSRQQDIAHVMHAWDFVAPGGRLVAITSPAWQYRQDRKATAFRAWLADRTVDVEELPAGTFRVSGTDVRSLLVVID